MKRFLWLMERVRSRLDVIARTREPSSVFSLATLLLMISKVYGGALCLRRHLYAWGVLPAVSLPCRVISIGNIVAGGTGKTPMTVCVARMLRDAGVRVAVVSRGYRGTMETAGGVVSDGRTIFAGAADAGDEPYLMARLLPDVPVIVGRNRYRSGQTAVERFDTQVVVLDDAFQHLRLQRDVDLVLLDGRSPLGNGHLLPRGLLREPVSALQRARAIVYTRCNMTGPPASVGHRSATAPSFLTVHQPVIRRPGRGADPFIRDAGDLSDLTGRHALAFAGLADTAQFFLSLERAGCILDKTIAFGDHHHYRRADLKRIAETARETGADVLVTTLKDFVKFEDHDGWPLPVVVVDVEIHFKKGAGRFAALFADSTVKKIKT
jgi:tetraacyldisaccharide 4'-kinase